MTLHRVIRMAVIQTTLDAECAWDGLNLKMSAGEELRAIAEIGRAFSDLYQNQLAPNVVILPELSVPRGFIPELQRLAEGLRSLVVAGVDYSVDRSRSVMNQGVLIVPEYWGNRRSTFGTTIRFFGKTYPAQKEKGEIEKRGFHFKSAPTVWVVNGHELGKIGVCICYDLLDLSRLSMYRGQIQHLFVVAYNKDISSFQHVAETAARTIFCNVVVCNTGKFGGSLAIAPIHDPNLRLVFQQRGVGLFDCQVFELRVASLVEHQEKGGIHPEWKGLPPGYKLAAKLEEKRLTIKSKFASRR